jgi:hypothetical protein
MSAKLVSTFADRRCRVVSATDPHGRILDFLYRSRYYFFQVAPQLYSRHSEKITGHTELFQRNILIEDIVAKLLTKCLSYVWIFVGKN